MDQGLGIDVIARWGLWLLPLGILGAWAVERPLKRPAINHVVGVNVPTSEFLARGFFAWLALSIALSALSGSDANVVGLLVVQVVAVWAMLPEGDPRQLPWPEGPGGIMASLVAGIAGLLALGTGLCAAVWALSIAAPSLDWPRLQPLEGASQVVATRLLVIGVAIPFCEEVLFRYGLLGWLIPRLGRTGACVAAALVFAAAHFEDSLFLARLAGGAAMGWLYLRRRDIVAPVVVHAGANLAVLLSPSLPAWFPRLFS